MPETPEKDPVVSHSLSGIFFVSAALLIGTLGWALYDEIVGQRPWKDYQRRFVDQYARFLKKQIPKQRAAEKEILSSPEYQELERKYRELEASVQPRLAELDRQAAMVDQQLQVVMDAFTTQRAYVTSQVYIIEHTSNPRSRKSLQNDLEKYKQGPFEVALPATETGGRPRRASYSYAQLEDQFNILQQEKGKLLAKKAEVLRPLSELRNKRDNFLKEHIEGLTAEQLAGLLKKTEVFEISIKQINNPDAGLLDRCESCHAGIREPAALTKTDMGGEAAFTSHPVPELLRVHDPEKFGCGSCHNGNGMEVSSVHKAHGLYEHWLWPLYPKENVEAGCQQCHASDMLVDHAPVLSAGKELFQHRGCMGCHRFQGYDTEPEELLTVQRSIEQLERERAEAQLGVQRAIKHGDEAPDNETARKFYAQADDLRVAISDMGGRIEQLDLRAKDLLRDMKKVGPDLKEVRVKLKPEWVPVWIQNPHAFRPTTRMPRFRLNDDEVQDVAAFIWQSGIEARLPKQPPGNPVKGKESFETRGCMGCHAVGEGADAVGGSFAANLTRVGEKVKYDYLVRWIHNPRERTRPHCPYEKRDLTAQDYKKHGLPFVFDLDHSKCPNDGHELQVEQMTVMPNLRLSWQEARDIASYLMTLKEKDPASYPVASYLNDRQRKPRGEVLVKRYGCAGCHEIAGLEEEGRIGTELTVEGSKPLEQFDFGLFVREAREKGWYSHKGFFEHKLAKPERFDEGMIKAPSERLRMPDFNLRPEEIRGLTTFLMGSVSSQVPPRYFYRPEDQRRDIQEGWWIIKKYNCMGCHQLKPDQPSVLMTLPRYQSPDWKDKLPPSLWSEGARVHPEWLARFLANPAMSAADADRNGVRSYLQVRMPTFYFSPIEIRKLVRFFQALSSQPMPYIPPKLEPLTDQEKTLARALFTSAAAPCLKCHATGEPSHDRLASAPNFLLAPERLKPGWTKRWILDPAMIAPGTAMPSGLFKREGERWVFSGPTPPIFKGYSKDHADLLVRYMFAITPEEQRRLLGARGSTAGFPAPKTGKSASGSAAALRGTPGKVE